MGIGKSLKKVGHKISHGVKKLGKSVSFKRGAVATLLGGPVAGLAVGMASNLHNKHKAHKKHKNSIFCNGNNGIVSGGCGGSKKSSGCGKAYPAGGCNNGYQMDPNTNMMMFMFNNIINKLISLIQNLSSQNSVNNYYNNYDYNNYYNTYNNNDVNTNINVAGNNNLVETFA